MDVASRQSWLRRSPQPSNAIVQAPTGLLTELRAGDTRGLTVGGDTRTLAGDVLAELRGGDARVSASSGSLLAELHGGDVRVSASSSSGGSGLLAELRGGDARGLAGGLLAELRSVDARGLAGGLLAELRGGDALQEARWLASLLGAGRALCWGQPGGRAPRWRHTAHAEVVCSEGVFVVRLDVKNFSPEEISVRVVGGFIHVHAQHDEKQ
ncbi:unnamed protein product, partial [Lampetra planeri]